MDPGTITKKNVKQYKKKYEAYYDEFIFKRNSQCQTCKIAK